MKRARFLVLRGGALGDFIVTLPALQALRARWPDAHIELVGYPHIAELARIAGLVDRVESLDRAQIARFFSLRPVFPAEQVEYVRSFDVILSYLHDPEGVVRENLLRAGARQVICASPLVAGAHAAEHLMKPLETLAIYAQGDLPALRWPDALREAARNWAVGSPSVRPLLAMHPGSGSPRKNWMAERFAELTVRLEDVAEPVLILGEADESAGRAMQRVRPGLRCIEGRPLADVASALSLCGGFVGNDSGISHLAASLGLPCVVLFGPSDPQMWAPRGPRVEIIRAPGGDLNALDVDAVEAAVRRVMR